jgi:hypothetical protein
LNPIGFTLSTCSTLSTLVSPLIELSSKHQNSQESFHLSIPLAGGMPVYSASRRHAHAVTCTIFIIARTYQGSYRCVSTLRGLRKSGRQKISQASHALVAPCISSIMSPDPHVGAQQPCTCLPWAIKGMAHNVTRHSHSRSLRRNSNSQVHKQYNIHTVE